jgi:ATP-dependent DNA ligase
MAFDCLHAAGHDLRPLELRARRDWLEDVLEGHLILPARRLADDGLTAWAEVLERGYEGLVAKDPSSRYRGGRTLKWLKVKQRGVLRRRTRLGSQEQIVGHALAPFGVSSTRWPPRPVPPRRRGQ